MDELRSTFYPEFEEIIYFYRGAVDAWIGDGDTSTTPPTKPHGETGVMYVQYVDGTVQRVGPVSAYYYAVQGGYTGTFAEWAQAILDTPENMRRAEAACDGAEAAQTAAETAATTAGQHKDNAAGWATGATTGNWSATNNAKYYSQQASSSETSASTSASNASSSASSASSSAVKAEGWATGGTGGTSSSTNNSKYFSQVSEGWATGRTGGTSSATNNAKYYSQASEVWATGGTGGTPSATNNAKYYSEQAGTSATNAHSDSLSASTSATAATNAQTAAETARDNAAGWATGNTTGSWSATNNSKYYSDLMSGMLTEFDSVLSNADIKYCISTSGSAHPADDDQGWSASVTPVKGDYVWQRTIYTWADNSTTKVYTVSYLGVDGSGAVHSVNTLVGNVVLDGSSINVDASAATPVTIGTAIAEKADKADTVLTTTLSRGRNTALGTGTGSFAFGNNVQATANYSHAEGSGTSAREANAHAEGSMSTASGAASHAEGYYSTASGSKAHAEGSSTEASGVSSHAEGTGTIASLSSMHANGAYNIAPTTYPNWTANTNYFKDISRVLYSGKGYQCIRTNSDASWTASNWTEIPFTGEQIFVVGNGIASNSRSNAMTLNVAGDVEFAGSLTMNGSLSNSRSGNVGENSFAFGAGVTASGACSHAEGSGTTATKASAHAEGTGTTASGQYSHAEGYYTTASNLYSHAEGWSTQASEEASHAEGIGTTASAYCSHAEGSYTTANLKYMHASGRYNVVPTVYPNWVAGTSYVVGDKVNKVIGDAAYNCYRCKTANNDETFDASKWDSIQFNGDELFVVGNGNSANEKSNAMTLTWEGDATFARDIYSGTKKVSGHTELFDSATAGVNAGYITDLDTTNFTFTQLKAYRAGDVVTITALVSPKVEITAEKALFHFSIKPTYVNFVSIFDSDYKQISGAGVRIATSTQLLSLAVTDPLSGGFRFNITFICDD